MNTKVITPDEGNFIDLPGVGPCPRPVDIDQSVTGFARLKSLRVYRFAKGQAIDGESEVDEVLIVPLSGRITMEISGASPLRADLVAGRILYMPPDHAYRLTVAEDAVVAYGRAAASGDVATSLPQGAQAAGEVLRLRHIPMDPGGRHGSGDGERLILVAAGAVSSSAGPVGPLSVLALGDGQTCDVVADDGAELWVYSA